MRPLPEKYSIQHVLLELQNQYCLSLFENCDLRIPVCKNSSLENIVGPVLEGLVFDAECDEMVGVAEYTKQALLGGDDIVLCLSAKSFTELNRHALLYLNNLVVTKERSLGVAVLTTSHFKFKRFGVVKRSQVSSWADSPNEASIINATFMGGMALCQRLSLSLSLEASFFATSHQL